MVVNFQLVKECMNNAAYCSVEWDVLISSSLDLYISGFPNHNGWRWPAISFMLAGCGTSIGFICNYIYHCDLHGTGLDCMIVNINENHSWIVGFSACWIFLSYWTCDLGTTGLLQRRKQTTGSHSMTDVDVSSQFEEPEKQISWKRILLLIIAITVHNVPGKFDSFKTG